MKKGFTLIELVAVIMILGIILVAVMPVFTDTLNRTKERLNDTQKSQLVAAARNWGLSNVTKATINKHKYVTVGTLKSQGFLEDKKLKNLLDKKDISANTIICIRYKNNQFVYTFQGDKIEGEGTCKK